MQSASDDSHLVTVLILDSNAVFRAGLRVLLNAENDFTIVGEYDEPDPAVAAIGANAPEIVLLGVEREDAQAAGTLDRILEAGPSTNVVVFGDASDQRAMRALIARGARAYLPKSVPFRHLVSVMCIVSAQHGDIALSASASETEPAAPARPPVTLSVREQEVLSLVAQAMSNQQVARMLDITEATVKRHLRNVFTKLNAVSRIDAVNKAVEASIIEPPVRNVHPLPTAATSAG